MTEHEELALYRSAFATMEEIAKVRGRLAIYAWKRTEDGGYDFWLDDPKDAKQSGADTLLGAVQSWHTKEG